MTGQFDNAIHGRRCHWAYRCIPYVVWELWRLHSAGLYNRERKVSRGAVAAISLFSIRRVVRLLRDVPDGRSGFFQPTPSVR